MPTKKNAPEQDNPARVMRASVSFPLRLYRGIEEVAREKKVSLAWVIREAVEKYVADQSPLFNQAAWRKP